MNATAQPRNAATIIALQRAGDGPRILMGRRLAGAVFMPNKMVFPGGALDACDADVPFARPLTPRTRALLEVDADPVLAPQLAAAALREFAEETGLRIARPGIWTGTPPTDPTWAGFAAAGLLPDAGALDCIYRAVTPPGKSRRFDARFFLVEDSAIAGDPEDFSSASGELADLAWVPLDAARQLDLPFVTAVALAELAALLRRGRAPDAIPFYDQQPSGPVFRGLVA
ncbi:NUDIX domain-containing protein [Pseudooceanicola sp. CBS1P-1]|uniref:NUDIX domain-containing protein n=1 Tax=Pseudooceanicola albus TaxID=2692189 RepID=A0A6L7FY42_9RHOB|nr:MULTISPECIES: NUDIX domain-containing protein [Pseudooceanicola]MBT9383442.1 NUDIX domain-containing protein [Pseudooceanicola endophyticus]MXN16236.1 NUDIX domain-containing protein [Pseudooceanicola albus]